MKFSNTTITRPISEFAKAKTIVGPLNVFSLLTISMVWGHMLGLLNLWFLPLSIICLFIAYGSEITKEKLPEKVKESTLDL